MEVSRLAISASKRGKLISAGYTSLSSLSTVSSSHLAQELNISKTEADEILKLAVPNGKLESTNGSSQAIVSGGQTAWEMLKEVETLKCITTSCAALDNILGGGINCKEVTEIGGVPGIGKTQLGIQLAINVQLPHEHGGLAAKAIYIDTEGSFMVERVLQIAEACLPDSYELSRKGFHAAQPIRQPKDLLENIYYFRVCSYTEQIALINYLGKFIKEQKNVVLLNQVTTKYSEGSVHLTLALGDSWSHACTNRVILHWNGNERYAHLDKSPTLQSSSAPYSVTGKGIRDSVSEHKKARMI